MEIKTLSSLGRLDIFEAVKKSFEDYVIPLEWNETTTLSRWESSNVDFSLSYGVFDDSQLVAFILHIPIGKTLFNFMTGVIPSHRGQHLIEQISDEVSRKIRGFETYRLEVIKENLKALNLYKKLGFIIERELISFQGKLALDSEINSKLSYSIKPLNYVEEMNALRLSSPSMENSPEILFASSHRHEVHELRIHDELIAYAVLTPENLMIRELGARSHDDLIQLFFQMKLNGENLRVMNVEESAHMLIECLKHCGLKPFVTQYQMIKKL